MSSESYGMGPPTNDRIERIKLLWKVGVIIWAIAGLLLITASVVNAAIAFGWVS